MAGEAHLNTGGNALVDAAGNLMGCCCTPPFYQARFCVDGSLAGIYVSQTQFPAFPSPFHFQWQGDCYSVSSADTPPVSGRLAGGITVVSDCSPCDCGCADKTPLSVLLSFAGVNGASCWGGACNVISQVGCVSPHTSVTPGLSNHCVNWIAFNCIGGATASAVSSVYCVAGCATGTVFTGTGGTITVERLTNTGVYRVSANVNTPTALGGGQWATFYGVSGVVRDCTATVVISNSAVVGSSTPLGLCAMASGGTVTLTPQFIAC